MEFLVGLFLGAVLCAAGRWAYEKYARAKVEKVEDDIRSDL